MRKHTKLTVRGAYTLDHLIRDISEQRDALNAKGQKTSLRKIAKSYGVSHGAVQRVLKGVEPKTPKIRHAFGITEAHITVAVCPVCGETPTPKHKCKLIPKSPRRKYDLSYKEAREIMAILIKSIECFYIGAMHG